MAKEPPLREVKLADKLAAEASDEFVFPATTNQQAIDGFLKKSGRPVQLKTLTAAPKAQASKVVSHANEAFAKAAGWTNVDLHIEAPDVTREEVQARWSQPNRIPAPKQMPGGRITRIRVYCKDGVLDLAIPTGATGAGGAGAAAAPASKATVHAEPGAHPAAGPAPEIEPASGSRAAGRARSSEPTPSVRTPSTSGGKSVAAEGAAEGVGKVQRVLRGFGKGVETFLSAKVQVPLAVALELLNVVQMIDMATSKLAGQGFILNGEIRKANDLERDAASELNWYKDGYHTDLIAAIEDATEQIVLAGSREMLAEMKRVAPGILASLQRLVGAWSTMAAKLSAIEQEARTKARIADRLLATPEFYTATAFSGTAIAATVFALGQDLLEIAGSAGSAKHSLTTAIEVAREDIAMLRTFL